MKRNKRAMVIMLGVGGAAVLTSLLLPPDSSIRNSSAPVVGGDLHAVASIGERTLVGGHESAAYHDSGSGLWTDIRTLRGVDVMGWAAVGDHILVGGHGGLYESRDHGSTFHPSAAVPQMDVHGLGASGKTVYLSSVSEGLLRSRDLGRTFVRLSPRPTIMGTIVVDPRYEQRATAVTTKQVVIETLDGGETWERLPASRNAVGVARDPRNPRNLAIVASGEVALSRNNGVSWAPIRAPRGTSAVTYTSGGRLLIAAVVKGRALTYHLRSGGGWERMGRAVGPR